MSIVFYFSILFIFMSYCNFLINILLANKSFLVVASIKLFSINNHYTLFIVLLFLFV